VKIVFHRYLHQKWIDLHQTKTKMITIHIVEYISPVAMLFCDNLLVIIWEGGMSQWLPLRAPTCFNTFEYMVA